MKYFILLLIVLVVDSLSVEAQKLTSVKPYGSKGAYELTLTNDTITVTPKYSASIYTMPIDTNVLLQVDTTASFPCNLLWFELSADATKRYVTFDAGLAAAGDSVSANKSKAWGFVYTGNKYVLINESAEY